MSIVLNRYQQAVVDAVVAGKNVIVDAVAGSGKTTTAMALARALPHKRIMQITYNRFLKEEVQEKTEDLKNITVTNHHSLAVLYYDGRAHNDIILQNVLDQGVDINPPKVDILVYDETQDKTLLYYRLARNFVEQLTSKPQLVLMGDREQCLYGFKDADERYLTLAHQLWPGYEFEMLTLPESRRVPGTVAQFVNTNMLGHERIISHKPGPAVEFVVSNPFDAKRVWRILQHHDVTDNPSEIFVLSPSVRSSKAPFKALANMFTMKNIPIYVSSNDESEVRDSVSANKVVFTSFHQSKGRERDVVIVYGMEKGYFERFGRDIKPQDYWKCPSTFYVACTRAKKLLIVISSAEDGPIDFLRVVPQASTPYMQLTGRYNAVPKPLDPPKHRDVAPTRLVRFIKPAHLMELYNMMSAMFREVHKADTPTDIPQLIEGCAEGTLEDISDINGLSIPAMWEYKRYKRCTVLDHVIHWGNTYDPFVRKFAKRVKLSHDPTNMNLAACVYLAAMDELNHRPAQIPQYDWLSEYDVTLCNHWLNEYIQPDAHFESKVEREYYSDQIGTVPVKGRMDIIDRDNIWEIKCTDELRIEHKLQLAIYAWMCNGCYQKDFKLMNIKTGEIQLLIADAEHLDRMMDIIMDSMYGIVHRIPDDEFIQRALAAVLPRNPDTVRRRRAEQVDVAKKLQSFMVVSDDSDSDSDSD